MLSALTLLVSLLSTPPTVTEAPQVPVLNTEAPEFKVVVPQEVRPIRALRPIAVMGEVGMNGLAGTGLNMSFNVHPNFALDTGFGVGTSGYKLGLRGRYNFSQSNLTPFIGAGAMMGFGGTPAVALDLGTSGRGVVQTLRAPMAQAVAGLSWVADGGFSLLASLGWAQVIGQQNSYTVQPGSTYTKEGAQAIGLAYGSGPVASLAMGYAF